MSARSYLPVIFTVAVLLPCAAFANTAKGTAVIIHNSVSGMDNQILYSSFYSADDGADEASTVFFNDGFGRLTAFEKEYKDGRMTIIIRQNMNIVWKNTYTVSSNHFSVKRIDTDGPYPVPHPCRRTDPGRGNRQPGPMDYDGTPKESPR